MSGRSAARHDSRESPAYPLGEAARYVKVPPATLRAWTVGRPYATSTGARRFPPLIRPAGTQPTVLSFHNLIEAHVLRALRTEHGVSIKAVRQALDLAERQLGIQRLFLRPELRSTAGQLFLDRYGELTNLSASGQLAMRHVLHAHLLRVSWDGSHSPIRLHPFVTGEGSTTMPIAIDPRIAFGRPVLATTGVSTAAIVDRIDAGETPEDVARDYDLTQADVEQEVLYERAA
jgi:uncharacterized protein (DUF433 family)